MPAVLGWFAPKPVLLPGPNKHRPWQRESNSKGLIYELKHILDSSLQVWSKNVKKRSSSDNKKKGKTIQEATDSVNYRPEKTEDASKYFGTSIPKNKVTKKSKKEIEETKIVDSSENKVDPVILPKKKEIKSNKNEKQEKRKAIQPATDSVNYRPENTEPVIKDSSVNDFSKKPDNKKKKRG